MREPLQETKDILENLEDKKYRQERLEEANDRSDETLMCATRIITEATKESRHSNEQI